MLYFPTDFYIDNRDVFDQRDCMLWINSNQFELGTGSNGNAQLINCRRNGFIFSRHKLVCTIWRWKMATKTSILQIFRWHIMKCALIATNAPTKQQKKREANRAHKSNGLFFVLAIFRNGISAKCPLSICEFGKICTLYDIVEMWLFFFCTSASASHPRPTLTPFRAIQFRCEHDDKIMYYEWCQCWCIYTLRGGFSFASFRSISPPISVALFCILFIYSVHKSLPLTWWKCDHHTKCTIYQLAVTQSSKMRHKKKT